MLLCHLVPAKTHWLQHTLKCVPDVYLHLFQSFSVWNRGLQLTPYRGSFLHIFPLSWDASVFEEESMDPPACCFLLAEEGWDLGVQVMAWVSVQIWAFLIGSCAGPGAEVSAADLIRGLFSAQSESKVCITHPSSPPTFSHLSSSYQPWPDLTLGVLTILLSAPWSAHPTGKSAVGQ